MNSLRFLLVHRSAEQSEEIAARLARANHSVLPTTGLAEATEAISMERFDAVLMESELRSRGLKEFSDTLRRMQARQRGANPVPVIGLSAESSDDKPDSAAPTGENLDAVIPERIDPFALSATVARLAQVLAAKEKGLGGEDAASLCVMEPEKFKEQVGFDIELMVEIIDLFLVERKRQEPEMVEALMSGKMDVLSRVAHTIKGSLSSLHALKARANAQELEYAAKRGDTDVCERALAALQKDLKELEPILVALRDSQE